MMMDPFFFDRAEMTFPEQSVSQLQEQLKNFFGLVQNMPCPAQVSLDAPSCTNQEVYQVRIF